MKSPVQIQDTRFLELLQKWQSGDFTRSDELEMNTLASGDAFRREAIDGLLEHPEYDHTGSLASLRDRLHAKRKGRRIGFPQILAMAAAVVLLIGAVWFFNIDPIPQDQGKLAQDLPAEDSAPATEQAPSFSEDESRSSAPALNKPIATQPTSSPEPKKDMAFSDMPKAPTAPADLDDKPGSNQNSEVTLNDLKKSESYQQPDAILERSTNSTPAGERAKEAAGQAMKKSKAPARSNAEEKVSSDAYTKSNVSTAAPTAGWDNFRVYLTNKARLTPAALANNVTGIVRLQFKIDKKNKPFDFIVVQKLGFGCDEAAIQLMKDAAWVQGNGLPVVVDVPFVR